jgi:DNA-binding transcriptional regulator YhcF (GntR family)
MSIAVDADDPTPPFEQIRASLAVEITSGRLAAGHRLPTVRQLAADLHVAAGTAARAYRELEEAGLVATRRSQGTVVRAGQAIEPNLVMTVEAFVRDIRRDHVELPDVIAAIEAAWATV